MALSGKTTVTTAGTEVPLAAAGERADCSVAVRAATGNSGFVYIGNAGDGTVSSATGFELDGGDMIILEHVGDLSTIKVDSSADAHVVFWLKLASMS